MKTSIKAVLYFIIVVVILANVSYSQSMVDAYRLSYLGLGFNARSLGLGTAYSGIANDFSAVYWNPAGLGQIQNNEISAGLSHNSYDNASTFLGNKESFSNSGTNFNSVGLVYPFPVQQGSLVFAIGYNRQSDFTSALGFHGYNDSTQTILYLPYLEQRAKVLEDGGVNNWVVGGAIEAVKNLYIGLSLNFISGTYTYNKNYLEYDINHTYLYTYGAQRKFVIDEDIGGFTGRLGMLYEFRNHKGRIGFNVKFPSYLSMKETYASDSDTLDWNKAYDRYHHEPGSVEFDVITPFVFSVGTSYSFGDLLLSGDIDYTDWTQMEFRNNSDLLDENTVIKEKFKSTMNVRVGAEFAIPETDLCLRAGFAYLPSPYTFDSSPNAQKFITGGLGWMIENSFRLDLGYAYGFWNTSDDVYYATVAEKVHTNNVVATVSYRF